MRYPIFLKKNNTIGLVAPSFGCTTEPYASAFLRAVETLEGFGFHCICGPNVHMDCGVGKSNTPEACAAEINDFMTNPDYDVVWSAGGGELMCEDLDYIDFELLFRSAPKWYMGFSDNTNLTFLLNTLCDTASIYGPCVSSFGMETLHPALIDSLELLQGKKLHMKNYDGWESEKLKSEENPYVPYNITEPFRLTSYFNENEHFSGRLTGGCLDCLVTLCGTKFDKVRDFNKRYSADKIIWFIEACDLNVFDIRRALWQLDNAGWFENAAGFLIGRPRLYDEPLMGLDRIEAVTGLLKKYKVPIILDVDLGHLPPMMPLISGAMADVSVKGNSIEINMQTR